MEHELKCSMPLAEVTGLRSGCTYRFRVQAFNEVGLLTSSYCSHMQTLRCQLKLPWPWDASLLAIGMAMCCILPAEEPGVCVKYGLCFLQHSSVEPPPSTIFLRPQVGHSQPSPVALLRTGYTVPKCPGVPRMTGATRSTITLAWKAPEETGGSQVLDYEAEVQPKSKAAMEGGMADKWLLVYTVGSPIPIILHI